MSATVDGYDVLRNEVMPGHVAAWYAVDRPTGRLLGGFGANWYRSWVFPLYTPSGLTVLQEFPYDHPFHNGLFVGQHPVICGETTANLWTAPPRRSADDAIFTQVGRMDLREPITWTAGSDGVSFTAHHVWVDEDEQPVLDEQRTVTFRAQPDATICELTSAKIAAYGEVEFPRSKYGSLGARVEPRLLPGLGAQVLAGRAGAVHRGTADEVANGRECDWVAYEHELSGGGAFGLCLAIADNSAAPERTGPWFIRDYGMAMFNATMRAGIRVREGAAWTATLRAVAYDGALSAERAAIWTTG